MELEEFQQVRRGMTIWMLQENADFTFKEARALMMDIWSESPEDLARILKVTEEEIQNLRNSAIEKLKK
ncbi:MAG: hypothetical protein FWC29_00715 [Methanomassiliicoccaceae archaeon]|nr:hypothetical protein [Methanomassiliicoccaceae archaeon]